LPSEFPIEVETFAKKIDTSITASESESSWHAWYVDFTIDPKDAKDFDDALLKN
jgi:ribonuclease R